MTTTLENAPAAIAKKTITKMAIIVRDDAFDRLLTPLAFAYEMGRRGVQVDVLCVLWASRVLTHEGVKDVKMDPRYADRKEYLLNRLAAYDEPQDIHGFIQAAHRTGNVRFHACKLAAATFEVSRKNLLPEAEGIIDPVKFLNEIAAQADHCQYF